MKKNRRRRRNIIWFNPPFSQTVKTNVAKLFFRLLDKHFPRSHILCKLFNRNTVKASCSCIENVAEIINENVIGEFPLAKKILYHRAIAEIRTCVQ